MEKKITEADIENLKAGQGVLINSPLFGEETAYLGIILEDDEQEDEKNKTSYLFLSSNEGDYDLKKEDLLKEVWNIRLIDETHTKFNKELSKEAISYSDDFNEMLKKLNFKK